MSAGILAPFAALSASYFAHIGFFNPYLPLWLKDMGFGLMAISVLTSVQSVTRLFAPYAWGWLSDRTGERVRLLRYGATAALGCSLGLSLNFGFVGGSLCVPGSYVRRTESRECKAAWPRRRMLCRHSKKAR